jgi:hypothetical protein
MATHELALQLERTGLWRKWLGEEKTKLILPHLSSQAAWDQFLGSTLSTSGQGQAELELCLQVRCVLYGEMAIALYAQNATGRLPVAFLLTSLSSTLI